MANYLDLHYEFIDDVLNQNPQNHNQFIHDAVNRHNKDLEKSKSKEYPFFFDEKRANKALTLIKLFKHTQGSYKGVNFDLQPFQAFIVASLFGWVDKKTGFRRFFKAYIEIARKNGKSEFAAAIELIMAFFDNEGGAEVYTVATTRDQAGFVYDAAKIMLKQLKEDFPEDTDKLLVRQHFLIDESTNSIIKKLTADGDTNDGANPHCGVVDEYHAHKNNGVYKVVETGMGSRDQPLLLMITTAGFYKHYPCYKFRQTTAVPTVSGLVENERLFVAIFTLDQDDDWHDPKTWIKSNPNLGNAPKLPKFESDYVTATIEGGSSITQFLTKNLNIWVDSAKTWIASKDWAALASDYTFTDSRLKGLDCVVGLDLASTTDVASASFIIDIDDKTLIINRFYIPESKIDKAGVKSVDGVDYRSWRDQGYLIVTPGKTIDYDYIIKDVVDSIFNVTDICIDPWNSHEITEQLEICNLGVHTVPQNYKFLHPPTQKLESMVINNKLIHDNNPVMAWMVGNISISNDAHGNMKIDKAKSAAKVDGPVATVIGLCGWMNIVKSAPKKTTITLDQVKNLIITKKREDDN